MSERVPDERVRELIDVLAEYSEAAQGLRPEEQIQQYEDTIAALRRLLEWEKLRHRFVRSEEAAAAGFDECEFCRLPEGSIIHEA